jgi:hypothetical protein
MPLAALLFQFLTRAQRMEIHHNKQMISVPFKKHTTVVLTQE